jgi:Uma2 family endonuclease
MSAVTITDARASRPFTRADLQDTPDDGRRYELIDGTLIVSPAPRITHQRVVGKLHLLLHEACPAGLLLLFAPTAVELAEDTELQPDLLVAPRDQFTEKELVGAPLLAVEVLSPSTRRVDLLLKRDRLQAAGCPSYWLVDPVEPSIVVLELEDGQYVERGRATGDESIEVSAPYPVTIVPAALLA